MELKEIKLELIHTNTLQPAERTENILSLAKSIEEFGLLTPLRVCKNGNGYTLIDGHRSCAALHQLGKESALCLVYDKEINPETAFLEMNQHSRKFTQRNYLEMYLKNGNIPIRLVSYIKLIEKTLGQSYLLYMQENKIGVYTVTRLINICENRLGLKTDSKIKKFISWVMECGCSKIIELLRTSNKLEDNKEKILTFVNQNKKFTIEDII